MRNTRRIVQSLIYILFIYSFFSTIYRGEEKALPIFGEKALANLFMALSPLNALIAAVTGHFSAVFIGAVLVSLLTIPLGRFFCGWICPMGTSIDLAEKITGGGKNRKEAKNFSWVKYVILTFILTTTLLGWATGHYFEPMSLIYRFYTFSIFPIVDAGLKSLQNIFPKIAGIKLSYAEISYRTGIFYFLIFLGIFLAGRYHKRFWCRNLCPVGALISIFGRFSLLQMHVSEKCNRCTKCIKDCKMGAILQDPKDFKVTECIYCFNCVESCPAISVKFAFEKPQGAGTIAPCVKNFITGKGPDSKETASGIDRRKFLAGAIGGVAAAALVKTDFGKKTPYQRLIRPPAALPEEQFTSVCIRCGECMKVCRTCGLQPTLFEGGIAGLMAPRLIPIAGYCDSACNMCQQVCPTGAIQPFAIEEKSNIILGTARIDRSACIAWYNEQYCLVCQEHCPYGAIYWKQIEGRLRPMVDEDLCVGCGYCENVCPVKPKSAIKIYSQGEVRASLKPGQKWSQINPRPENSPASKFIDMPPPAEGNR